MFYSLSTAPRSIVSFAQKHRSEGEIAQTIPRSGHQGRPEDPSSCVNLRNCQGSLKNRRPPGKNALEKSFRNQDACGIDTPLSISIAETLTPDEREELVQTVAALKTYTETNPDDDQSLEILKDAYWKLGDAAEGLRITHKLADAYLRQGQYSAALLEYEGLLIHQPGSPEITKIIAGLEATLNPSAKAEISLDFGVVDEPAPAPSDSPDPAPQAAVVEQGLIATEKTQRPKMSLRNVAVAAPAPTVQDANESLARFLIQYRMASRQDTDAALARVKAINAKLQADPEKQGLAAGLLHELIKGGLETEPLLTALLDRTKFAYVPLEYYDVDRQIVKMLPESLTLGRRVLPFDIVSRTLFVAIDNPFDNNAKTVVQQSVDYHIQWYFANPATIDHILRECYRLK
ncbi:MAG: hypothetical protein ACFUZC_05245 [Chthoniobacteraceae bacterium]